MVDRILLNEVNAYNFNRLIVPLANWLVENKTCKEAVLVYDSYVPLEIIDTSKFSKGVSMNHIKKEYDFAKENSSLKNIVFMTNGYRVSDLYWTEKFKKGHVRCYQIQHGMYAEFLKRDFLGYFSSIGKKLKYLQHTASFIFRFKLITSLYLINKDFIKSFRINRFIKNRFSKKIEPVLSDHLFLWGAYWKPWFIDNHFYNEDSATTVIGNPDYHVYIKDKTIRLEKDKVCYIAQSYVEDGRMKKEDYKRLIDRFSKEFGDKFIVKLHPRSDLSIYENVVKNGGELTHEFVKPKFYIGHYSSLLALAINLNVNIYILEINNELTPFYYKDSITAVCTNMDDLLSAISKHEGKKFEKRNISFYFENIETPPFDIVSNRLIKDIKD